MYHYDIGETLASAPEEDEKILAKVDWNINDAHRASLSYQHTEGNELVVNSTNNNPATNRLGAPSNWYDRAITMKTASLQVFSDWNDYFSSEAELARKEVDTGAGVALRHRVRRDGHQHADVRPGRAGRPALHRLRRIPARQRAPQTTSTRSS